MLRIKRVIFLVAIVIFLNHKIFQEIFPKHIKIITMGIFHGSDICIKSLRIKERLQKNQKYINDYYFSGGGSARVNYC